ECAEACPTKVPDPFNMGLAEVPAIRLPHLDAWPARYAIDRDACPDGCTACVDACKFDAIDLAAVETERTLTVSSVVLATGWHPYPLENLSELGGGVLQDVIANVVMERLVAPAGPTGGKILRPSDGEAPKRVAFVQCAGSRDVNHLPYCSAVCCLASLKQAIYVREQLPESEVTIYYIDRRTPGRNEDMLTRVAGMDGVRLVKGKVGKIARGPGKELVLRVEDVESGRLLEEKADLVVLATGMVSNLSGGNPPFDVLADEDGFGLDNLESSLFVTGVARRPEDVAASVRDATGAAAKASVAAIGSAI
ncbi:heterodisulfide reductase subunit A, partial [bacterium]|nr:heterodisulfide reductase subunit A [bacterium]